MRDTKFHRYDICNFCGKEFTTQNLGRHKIKCRDNPSVVEALRTTRYFCEVCAKEFTALESTSHRFCSKACSSVYSGSFARGREKKAACKTCGVEFLIPRNASIRFHEECNNCKKERKRKLHETAAKKVQCEFCSREITAHQLERHRRACFLNPEAVHIKHRRRRQDIRAGYIYKTVNLANSKFYVGKRAGSPEESPSYLGSGLALQSAIRKYGRESFQKEILEIISDGDLNERERFWIEQTKAFSSDLGYNMTEGGDGGPLFQGRNHLEETKEKIRKRRRLE